MKLKKAELKTDELKLENWNKTVNFLMLFMAISLSGCGLTVDVYPKVKDVRAKELDAGYCSTLIRATRKSNKSPFTINLHADSFRIQQSTDTVKAGLHVQFGLQYLLFAEQKTIVPIELVWTFPDGMVNAKGKKISQHRTKKKQMTHQRTWTSFIISEEYMIIEGEWKLEIFHKKKKMLEKIFYLI